MATRRDEGRTGLFRRTCLSSLLLLCATACSPAPNAPGASATPAPASATAPADPARSVSGKSVNVHIKPYSQPDPVSLPVGGTLSVEMLSGMETGYVARLSAITPPDRLKAQTEYDAQNDEQKAAAAKGWVGADIDRVFVFKAMKPGAATIGWRARRGDYDHGPDDLILQVIITPAPNK